MPERRRLLISFSGGRTSGYMTRRLLTDYADQYEMVVVFANTGEENEATLEFVRDCDEEFGFGTVWVEAEIIHGERRTDHRVVTFETAKRKGEPFEDMIAKYGIPNKTHPHCTRSLKRYPIESYARSIGWDDYVVAIGIRADESRRVKEEVGRDVMYPLVDWFPMDKPEIMAWWREQPFDLNLLEHQGNCKWCWKKSFRKHARIVRESPWVYDFPRRMEAIYGHVMPEQERERMQRPTGLFGLVREPRRVFFRGGLSTDALFLKVLSLPPHGDERERPDEDAGCSESCELFPTEIVDA